jgi:hypothetical protein
VVVVTVPVRCVLSVPPCAQQKQNDPRAGGAVKRPAKIPVKKEQTKNLPVLQIRTAYFVKQGDFI